MGRRTYGVDSLWTTLRSTDFSSPTEKKERERERRDKKTREKKALRKERHGYSNRWLFFYSTSAFLRLFIAVLYIIVFF